MPKRFPTPPIASFSVFKTLLYATGGSLLFVFLVWLFGGVLSPTDRGGSRDWSLSISELLLGSVPLPLIFYSHWAWRPRRRNGTWHRWLVNVAGCFYVSILLLLAALASWKAILLSFFPASSPVWRHVGVGILIGLFALAWALPVVSYALARRLEEAHHRLDFKLLVVSGGAPAALMVLAGILGADYGLHGGDGRIVALALLSALCAVGLAQYWAAYLWRYRPWAKDEEE